MRTPRDYQESAVTTARGHAAAGRRDVLIAMLMGAGKTGVAMMLMRACEDKGKRSLFVCDRRMLVNQAAEEALSWGFSGGVIMSGKAQDLAAPSQFASIQTLHAWAIKKQKIELPPADLLIIDEAHRHDGRIAQALREKYPNAFRLGLTATPCTPKGHGLGDQGWKALVCPVTPSELRKRDLIVPCKCFVPYIPKLKGVSKDKDGDWSARKLSTVLNRKNLVGDVVGWWKKLAEGRPSLYFLCDVAHAVDTRREFLEAGVACELIYAATDDDEREAIKQRLEAGVTKVVVNCDTCVEGVNWEFVSCIGLVRPTRSFRRFLQMCGRGFRRYPGKDDVLIIDHGGCAVAHGYPDQDFDWSLDPEDDANARAAARQKDPRNPVWHRCPECTLMFRGARICPHCGHVLNPELRGKKAGQTIDPTSGTLIEMSRDDELNEDVLAKARQKYWCVCICFAIKKGWRAGGAKMMFRKKYGLPENAKVGPLPATPDLWDHYASSVFWEFTPAGRRQRMDEKKAAKEAEALVDDLGSTLFGEESPSDMEAFA